MSWHRNYAKFCEKKSQNRRNQSFSYYFCLLMLEGSGSGSRSGSGSIPLTNGTGSGSGSRRPKNTWIRGIWIRIRIRIRNTAVMCILNFLGHTFFLNLYFPKYSNENNTIFDNYEQTTLLENDHFHQYFFTDCKDDILINRYTFMVRFHV